MLAVAHLGTSGPWTRQKSPTGIAPVEKPSTTVAGAELNGALNSLVVYGVGDYEPFTFLHLVIICYNTVHDNQHR